MRQIAIFLPSRSQNVKEDLDSEGTGAREQIADWLADGLTKDGYTVHVFTNQLESMHEHSDVYRGEVHYINSEITALMLMNYEWDAVISFDYPSITQLEDIKKTCKKVVVVQNYYEIPPDGIIGEEFLDLVDTWVYPSEFALRECSLANGIDPDKGVVIPYTWDDRFFKGERTEHEGHRFIYVNQAESGLAQTLRMWHSLNEALPGSTLTIATPVDEFVEQIQWSHSIQSELALDIRDLIEQDGVRYIGRQGRPALARELASSDYLLYPAEPLMPSEIGSLPLIQAIASGVTPIFRDVDALKELYENQGVCVPKDADFLDYVKESVSQGVSTVIPDNTPDEVLKKWLGVLNVNSQTTPDLIYSR